MESVAWGPALVVLALGVAAGAVLVWRLRGGAHPPDAAAARRRELEAHRDVLLDQLRELDDTALGRDPQELARHRDALELEAARVLAELDRQGAGSKGPRPAPAAAPRTTAAAAAPGAHAGRRGFIWGVASAAAVAVLVAWVSGAARPREEGGSVTGTIGPMGQGAQPSPGAPAADAPAGGPEAAPLKQRIASNPDDLDARLELTQVHLRRRELMQVWEQTQEVLARSPGHPRALSYQALVRLAMGQAEAAETLLQQAMKAAPELLEPRLHMSLVYMQTGRVAEADKMLDEAKRLFPAEAEGLDRLRVQMKEQAAAEPASTFEGHPEVAPRAEPVRSAADRVSGRIEMDGGRAAPAGGIVFVTARAVGQTEGPPLAVKRLPASFPVSFTLGREDSMMGEPLPNELRLDARLDGDGDPLTRSPQDPSARLDSVRLGQDGVRLRLR
jgi:tetratricopeptide (TPR) repeat protein